jgi:hypothetical protein
LFFFSCYGFVESADIERLFDVALVELPVAKTVIVDKTFGGLPCASVQLIALPFHQVLGFSFLIHSVCKNLI